MILIDFIGKNNLIDIPLSKFLLNLCQSSLSGHISQHDTFITERVSHILSFIFNLFEVGSDSQNQKYPNDEINEPDPPRFLNIAYCDCLDIVTWQL